MGLILGRGPLVHAAMSSVMRWCRSWVALNLPRSDQGLSVGLVNKCHANVVDEKALQKIGNSRFVLCVESQSTKTGLGIRLGTWLLERELSPKYARLGTHRQACGGTWKQAYHQGYDSESIMAKVKEVAEQSR